MTRQALDEKRMRRALKALDARMTMPARLVIGRGAAMTLAYDHPMATQDVDAFAAKGGLRIAELSALARSVAEELNIEPDWLNSHFETFTAVLPADYASRLRSVYVGQHLRVDALGPEDLLIMKCFAGRDKDRLTLASSCAPRPTSTWSIASSSCSQSVAIPEPRRQPTGSMT